MNGHFLNQGKQQKESDGLHLSYTVPDIEGLLSHCSYCYQAMGKFYFLNKLGPLDDSHFMALRIQVDPSQLLLFKYKVQEDSLRMSKP